MAHKKEASQKNGPTSFVSKMQSLKDSLPVSVAFNSEIA